MEARKEVSTNNNVDRISQLPDSLCHHVLSFLSVVQGSNVVFLSRRWRSIWYSVPVYVFDDFFRRQSSFLKMLEGTLICRQRYFSYLSIHRFCLHMRMPRYFDPLALRWIEFALETNVKDLTIHNQGDDRPTIPSILCDAIFSARSITKLNIFCHSIEGISVSVSLPSLQELFLLMTSISDSTLQKLISGCSAVRIIRLEYLRGLEKIKISSETVVELIVTQGFDITECSVDYAPNLKLFSFQSLCVRRNRIRISVFRKLTSLKLIESPLTEAPVTDSMVASFLSQNPLLETLWLEDCRIVEKLLIASPKLGSFSLLNCTTLVEVKIDAPNLQELKYSGELVTFSSVVSSPLLKSRIDLGRCNHISSTLWYAKLKDLFEKLQYSKTLIVSCRKGSNLIIPGKMRKSLLPQLHALKHLKVEIGSSSHSNGGKLEKGLRWMFPRLRTLDIIWSCDCWIPVAEHYEYKEDMRQLLGGNAGISLENVQFRELIRWLFIKLRWLFNKPLFGVELLWKKYSFLKNMWFKII